MWELNPLVRLSATRRLKRMSIAGMVLRRPNIPSVSPNFGAGRGFEPIECILRHEQQSIFSPFTPES